MCMKKTTTIFGILLLSLIILSLIVYETPSLRNIVVDVYKKMTVQPDPLDFQLGGLNLTALYKGEPVQKFEITGDAREAYETIGGSAEQYITSIDVNFDGYVDVGVFDSTGYAGVNNYYVFYIFNPKTKQFTTHPDLPALSSPNYGTTTQTIVSTYRSGPVWYTDVYAYIKTRDNNKHNAAYTKTTMQLSDIAEVESNNPTEQVEQNPILTTVSPVSVVKGEVLTLEGKSLAGFEGDLELYMERNDGKVVRLLDSTTAQGQNRGSSITVPVTEPCAEGETVIHPYSGEESVCDYVEITKGVYKAYVMPWGKKSNSIDVEVK